jgi:signal transduction histidine kinase
MRIRHKILLGYLAFIASAVVMVAFFLTNLGDISTSYGGLMKHDERMLVLVNNLRASVWRQVVAARTFELRRDLSLQVEYRGAITDQQVALGEIDALLTQQDDRDAITNIKSQLASYTRLTDKVMIFPNVTPQPSVDSNGHITITTPAQTLSSTPGTDTSPGESTFAPTNLSQPFAGAPLVQNMSADADTLLGESETVRLNLLNSIELFVIKKTTEVTEAQNTLDVKVTDISAQLLVLSLLGGLGALIGAMLLTESFTAPLRRLMRNIQGISSGDLHTAVAVRSRDEIGELAGVLETMRQRLAQTAAENTDLLTSAREEAEKLAKAQQDLESANAGLQEALKTESEARKRMEEIDRLKSEFTSMISHELKTPVSYVYNYAGALKEHNNSLNDSQRIEFLTAIQGEAQHLLTLIDDIMAISLLESVGLTHHFVETDLRKLADSVVKVQQLTTRRHTLTVKGPENLPVRADPTRLKQVLNNLVSNAIKYSPQGGQVEVRLRANPADNTAMVYVRDYGIGIDPEDVPKLFDRFIRIQRKETLAIPGSGLGLYIAHHIVQAHGGTLKLEPAPGKGTIAEVTVPLMEAATQPEEGDGATGGRTGRVQRIAGRIPLNGHSGNGHTSDVEQPVGAGLNGAGGHERELEKELVG